ncbi:MAG: hypothetical protein GMKNLPBB_02706 [Myxococcota bacterium]|nr:hypothetical protein [Myxococcota bacterium]
MFACLCVLPDREIPVIILNWKVSGLKTLIPPRTKRVLNICGSINQTTQLHQIARELPEYEHWFTPFYGDGEVELARKLGLIEMTIGGDKRRQWCLDYLRDHNLSLDMRGEQRGHAYDLVVTCSDLVYPGNIKNTPVVVVQEGMIDRPFYMTALCRKFPFLPLWLAGCTLTGCSLMYDVICAASEGYRSHFLDMGVPGSRIRVTGIPNFDNCARYRFNDFPHRGYALVCTSDKRETFQKDDRMGFLRKAREWSRGKPVFFKLHPNEDYERARREIHQVFPEARVYQRGATAEHMIANCDILITQYSSTIFVGLALGKECHSSEVPVEILKPMTPIQNGRAAENIAGVCRELLGDRADGGVAEARPFSKAA